MACEECEIRGRIVLRLKREIERLKEREKYRIASDNHFFKGEGDNW